MNNIIGRLVKCGIPIKTSICIYSYFKKQHKTDALVDYVKAVEAEHERI